jgi:hypothetical protein
MLIQLMRLTAIAPESKLKELGESRRMSINTSTALQDTVLKTLRHRLIEQLGSNLSSPEGLTPVVNAAYWHHLVYGSECKGRIIAA